MSEHENQLQKALADEGPFDAEKARRAAADAVARINTRRKLSDRLGWVAMIVCIALFEFAVLQFQFASSTKAMIAYAVVILLAYGFGVLLKMVSGLGTATLSILKELKLLRWENLRRAPAGEAAAADASLRFQDPFQVLPWWENLAWIVVLIGVALGVALCTAHYANPGVPRPTITSYLAVASNGSGTQVLKVSYLHLGFGPRLSFPFTTGDVDAKVRWVDGQGRTLAATSTVANGRRRYDVQFIEPVMPGELVRYTQTIESTALATLRNRVWTCRTSIAFGDDERQLPPNGQLVAGLPAPSGNAAEPQAIFNETVELPRGAQIVATDPPPSMTGTCVWGDVPARGFHGERSRNEPFTCTIEYRLAEEQAPGKPAK
jgi:hypothetical protein